MTQSEDDQIIYRRPAVGALAPWFKAPSLNGLQSFAFSSVAGRAVLLLLFGRSVHPPSHAALAGVVAQRDVFDDVNCSFFGVTIDPADEAERRIGPMIPGIRFFLDYDRAISALYGAVPEGDQSGAYNPHFVVLDRQMRIAGRFPIDQHEQAIALTLEIAADAKADDWAPVLQVPRVFEPELCRHLIGLYEADGGSESGFMVSVDGKTVPSYDSSHKKRRDYAIDDESLRKSLSARLNNRLVPMIKRALNFNVTRLERYIVACYDAADGGHFKPHRDNTTKGTAHRRFAVTINLNAEEYEGGDLRFPEFGQRTYRTPTGGAIVFGCSLLHQALPVTRGKRYAFLPFLYDDEAAREREANNAFLDERVGSYRNAEPPA